jgi:hypothetical protein
MLPATLASLFAVAGDSPAPLKGSPSMERPSGLTGFVSRSTPVASRRLTDAVVASLAFGAFSLCLVVTLTVLSIKAGLAI